MVMSRLVAVRGTGPPAHLRGLFPADPEGQSDHGVLPNRPPEPEVKLGMAPFFLQLDQLIQIQLERPRRRRWGGVGRRDDGRLVGAQRGCGKDEQARGWRNLPA